MATTDVDLSYKDNARRAYYDIEVLPDVFTNLLITRGHVTLMLLAESTYSGITDEQITESMNDWMQQNMEDLVQLTGENPVFDLRRHTVGEPVRALRFDLDTMLSCGSLWDDGEQFTEYAGWNSANYDLPMLCAARLLYTSGTISTREIRTISDALVSFDGKPWELWAGIEKDTGLVREKSMKARLGWAAYADGHIDLAGLARIVNSDDTGAEARFPPGLKKEMARSGMDIVIDENVSSEDYAGLDETSFIELLRYNANDVLGTGLTAGNRVIVGQLATRDIVRRMYPYTAARATPLEKAAKYAPAARDATAAHIASLVLVGPNRAKPRDYPGIDYTFPIAEGKVDLLDYMRDHEQFMHPLLYQFFDHFRGKDTSSSHDNWVVQKSQPITHSAQMNLPYYRDGKPTNTYIRLSTGGAHGSVMAGLSGYSEEMVDQWVRADVGATTEQKPTLDLTNVIHVDWSSFYPTMASKMQIYKTSDGKDRYTGMIEYRLKIKQSLPHLRETWTEKDHALNQEQDGLKFVLNSATGAGNMHRKFAMLPIDNKTQSMRLCGNLHIWCLCQRMTQAGGFIISTNTDGFYVTGISMEEAQEVIDDYIAVYGMGVEPEIIDRFINRDTSNRIEYQGTFRSAVAGRLRHGVQTVYTDDSIGKNVPYPLAAAHAVLRYMDDPDWLSKPYDRERLAGIIRQIHEDSTSAASWYHIHAGSAVRHMTCNGRALGKVNRVVLTREGDELGSEQVGELTKDQTHQMIRAWDEHPHTETIRRVLDELGLVTVRPLPEDAQLTSYGKDEDGQVQESSDLSMFRLTRDAKLNVKLAVRKGSAGAVAPLKIWKPTALTGYPSTTGRVLNSKAELDAFDLSQVDEDAYTDWAEQLLAGWKITADLPEIGMASVDDTVLPGAAPRMTKASAAMAVIEDIYTALSEGQKEDA